MKTTDLKNVNIPHTKVAEILTPERRLELSLPMFLESVSAGFPSPADDYIEGVMDMNEYLIRNPSSTFFVRVTGESMLDAGIHSGDILVVDRSIAAKNGSIIIATINGELLVKRLQKVKNKFFLYPENSQFKPLEITSDMSFDVWGVVGFVIHPVGK